jgi:hypothetical protein
MNPQHKLFLTYPNLTYPYLNKPHLALKITLGSNAGGWGNTWDNLAMNPQYKIVLEDSDEDADDLCTCVISLMPKVIRYKLCITALPVIFIINSLSLCLTLSLSLSISLSPSLSLPPLYLFHYLYLSLSVSIFFTLSLTHSLSLFVSLYLSHSLSHTLSLSVCLSLSFSLSLSLGLGLVLSYLSLSFSFSVSFYLYNKIPAAPSFATKCLQLRLHIYYVLGGGTHALHGSTSPPPPYPSPVSQPAFKFKRFGVQFQSFCCSFFFSVADFFSRTKSFIDIEDIEVVYSNVFLREMVNG